MDSTRGTRHVLEGCAGLCNQDPPNWATESIAFRIFETLHRIIKLAACYETPFLCSQRNNEGMGKRRVLWVAKLIFPCFIFSQKFLYLYASEALCCLFIFPSWKFRAFSLARSEGGRVLLPEEVGDVRGFAPGPGRESRRDRPWPSGLASRTLWEIQSSRDQQFSIEGVVKYSNERCPEESCLLKLTAS